MALEFLDPLALFNLLWRSAFPRGLYNKQIEIVYSVRDNEETFVPAGNMLGKDFISAFIVLWFFLSAMKFGKTCRIITTSVSDQHMKVLWGEIGRFVTLSNPRLDHATMGDERPLVFLHREIRRASLKGLPACEISYIRGMVAEKGEGMAGHHADYTLVVGDEASGIDDINYTQSGTWAKRGLWIGNCNSTPVRNNFFFKAVQGGDIPMEEAA